jgi:hypothetical protein
MTGLPSEIRWEMTGLPGEVRRRDRVLWRVGLANLALAALMLLGLAVDERVVLGLNPWVKPLKFALSITIYVWTIAWLLGDVRPCAPRAARAISGGTGVAMLVEIAAIAGQSLRGRASHFNAATPLDGAIFSAMGTMILLNTLLAGWLLVLYFRCNVPLPRPRVWGARLGLLVFLAGSAIGGLMISRGAHAVGAADGGPGLPFVNWSTEGGDLRPSHAVGLHALQVLPILGWALSRVRRLGERGATAIVFVLAGTWALATALVLAQALGGRPLLAA